MRSFPLTILCGLFVLVVHAKAAEPLYAVDSDGNRPAVTITAHDHCAWPNLTLLEDGRTLAAFIFNNASHGHRPGDVECWLIDWNGLDGGYPSSVERADGQIVTAYYSSALPDQAADSMKGYHMGVVVWDSEKSFSGP